MEEGTLSIVRCGQTFRVRYAANNPHAIDRQPHICPDEAALRALLQHCGIDMWSLNQGCVELRKSGLTVLLIALSDQQVQESFPPLTTGSEVTLEAIDRSVP